MIAPLSGLPDEPSEAERAVCPMCNCRIYEEDASDVVNGIELHRSLGCVEAYAVQVLELRRELPVECNEDEEAA